MVSEYENLPTAAPLRSDIGWKQFSISIFDLIRWPVAIIAIVLILRLPLEKLLDAISVALRT